MILSAYKIGAVDFWLPHGSQLTRFAFSDILNTGERPTIIKAVLSPLYFREDGEHLFRFIPPRREVGTMAHVTYSDLIQIGIFIIALLTYIETKKK